MQWETGRGANRMRSTGRGGWRQDRAWRLLGLALLLTQLACPPQPSSRSAAETNAERRARIFAATCAHCHVAAAPGAPRAGVPEDWNARETQDFALLLQHTIEGYGDMPPLGTCSFCSAEDLRELIALMVVGSSVAVPARSGESRP